MTTRPILEEGASYLKMGKSTIYKLAREGNMLAYRASRIWRFDAAEVDEWMKQSPDIAQLSQCRMVKA